MQHAQVEGELGEVDVLAHRITRRFGGLVERVEVRPSFHFHHREALAVVEVEVAAILQECSPNGHRALVIEGRAVHQERRDAVEAEAVVQPVGVLGVFFVHDVGDHDVADAAIQRGRFPQHVDAPQCSHAHRDLAKHVIGSEPERVVDIDQDRGAALQPIGGRIPESRIEVPTDEAVEDDDLRGHVETGLAGEEEDATLLLLAGALGPSLLGFR